MNTIHEGWESFSKKVLKGANPDRMKYNKAIFYSGSLWVMILFSRMAAQGVSPEAFQEIYASLRDEAEEALDSMVKENTK